MVRTPVPTDNATLSISSQGTVQHIVKTVQVWPRYQHKIRTAIYPKACQCYRYMGGGGQGGGTITSVMSVVFLDSFLCPEEYDANFQKLSQTYARSGNEFVTSLLGISVSSTVQWESLCIFDLLLNFMRSELEITLCPVSFACQTAVFCRLR